eukprot:g77958.t1
MIRPCVNTVAFLTFVLTAHATSHCATTTALAFKELQGNNLAGEFTNLDNARSACNQNAACTGFVFFAQDGKYRLRDGSTVVFNGAATSYLCQAVSASNSRSISRSPSPSQSASPSQSRSPSSGFFCNDGCEIEKKFVNDTLCDCSDCGDEQNYTCATCFQGCPQNCGNYTVCKDPICSNQTFENNVTGQCHKFCCEHYGAIQTPLGTVHEDPATASTALFCHMGCLCEQSLSHDCAVWCSDNVLDRTNGAFLLADKSEAYGRSVYYLDFAYFPNILRYRDGGGDSRLSVSLLSPIFSQP